MGIPLLSAFRKFVSTFRIGGVLKTRVCCGVGGADNLRLQGLKFVLMFL